jgi:hypothetical protein
MLVIKNERILDFCKRHPSFCPEQTLVSLIENFECLNSMHQTQIFDFKDVSEEVSSNETIEPNSNNNHAALPTVNKLLMAAGKQMSLNLLGRLKEGAEMLNENLKGHNDTSTIKYVDNSKGQNLVSDCMDILIDKIDKVQ